MPNPLFASLTAEPGPHPTAGELRDYAAGLLPPAAQQHLEAHTLACPRCADALAGWQQSPAAPADAAVARLRQRLRQRVQQLEPVGEVAPPPAVVPTGTGRLPQGPAVRRWAAAAAVAGLSVVGLWAWQHHGGEELAQPPVATEAPMPRTGPTPDVAATAPAQPAAPTPETAAAPKAEAAPAITAAPAAAAATAKPAVAAVVRPASPAVARARPGAAAPSAPAMASTTASGTAGLSEEAAADAAAPDAQSEAAATPPSVAYNAPAKAKDLKATPPTPPTEADQTDHLAAATVGRARAARALPNAAASPTPTALPAPAPVAPAPVGGWLALRERLRRQAADFDPAENAGRLTGTVRLRLLVGADGKVQESKILRGLRADYDAEALRLTTETAPLWQPGLANGRRAALPVEITVSF